MMYLYDHKIMFCSSDIKGYLLKRYIQLLLIASSNTTKFKQVVALVSVKRIAKCALNEFWIGIRSLNVYTLFWAAVTIDSMTIKFLLYRL